jgi:hypothetical protein
MEIFKGIDFNDSFVLDWSASKTEIVFKIEASIGQTHRITQSLSSTNIPTTAKAKFDLQSLLLIPALLINLV